MANKLNAKACIVAAVLAATLPNIAAAKSYLDEMSELDAQIALLNKRAELRNALQSQSSSLELPAIASIIDDRNGASAKLIYSNGIIRWVAEQDDLGNGTVVNRITRNSVQVAVGKKRVSLPFATADMLSGNPAAAQGGGQPGQGGQSMGALTIEAQAPSIRMPPMPTPQRLPVPVAPAPAPVDAGVAQQ